MSLPVAGQFIDATECLGDSLVKINNNTQRFQDGINTLNSNLSSTNTTLNTLNTTVVNLSTSILQAEFTTGTNPYTVLASDLGRTIRMNFSTVNQIRLPGTLPIGFTVSVLQEGLGQTSFVAAAAGVVIQHPDNFTKIYKRWSVATAIFLGSNTWVLVGDLTV